MVFNRRQIGTRHFGIADHSTVGRDEGYARAAELTQPIGFGVRVGQRIEVREQGSGEPRLGEQPAFDVGGHVTAQGALDEHRGDDERERRRDEDAEERAGPERHGEGRGASSSLYPNCLTVVSAVVKSGIFSRSRRTWTSTVRVPPVYW